MRITLKKNITLLEALIELSPESSKTTLRSWLKEGRVFVDKQKVSHPNQELKEGSTLQIEPKKHLLKAGLEVLYADKHIIVINKPAGLLSVASESVFFQTAHAFIKEKYLGAVHPVHRLDQVTSGVMIFAFSRSAKEGLKKQFAKHSILREYYAIVEGHLSSDGTWEDNLLEDKNYKVHINKKGQKAISHYKVLLKTRNSTHLLITLETGRKNQIRVQSSSRGHFIAGDKKYGAKTDPFNRLALHAQFLGFVHPITGKKHSFFVPAPFSRLEKNQVGSINNK